MIDAKRKIGSFIQAKASHGFHHISRSDYQSWISWKIVEKEMIIIWLKELEALKVIDIIDQFDGDKDELAIIQTNIPSKWYRV